MNTIKKTIKDKLGFGYSKLKRIYEKSGLNFRKNAIFHKIKHKKKLKQTLNTTSYAGSLKIKIKHAIEHYIKLKNYRGLRHTNGYPARGQRTHTNSRTSKKMAIRTNEKNTSKKKN